MDINNLNSYTVYKGALYYSCTLLISSMEYYLEKENRYYGKVKSYVDSMKLAIQSSEEKTEDWEKDIYGRVLVPIRIQIKKDFMRLGNRKMSCADRIIIIMRWILKIEEFIPERDDFKFSKEATTFSRILEHMYDNIKNHSKKDQFHNLTKLIEKAINTGELSSSKIINIDLVNSGLKNRADDPRKKKELKIKEEKTILKESNKLLQEIDFLNPKNKNEEA